MLDALDCDVDVENYPRVMYEAGRETEPKPHRQHEEEYPQGLEYTPDRGEQHMREVETDQLERIGARHSPEGDRRRVVEHTHARAG
jgi:hypothetical protein